MPSSEEKYFDVFICHASEDKTNVVKPLCSALGDAEISFWLDEGEIDWGDSIIEKVNAGLAKSRYVIVVLSDASIDKHWPLRELNAMLNKEASSGIVKILPLLIGTKEIIEAIYERMPLLNDKSYLTWNNNTTEIIESLLKRLSRIPQLPKNKLQTTRGTRLEINLENNFKKANVTPSRWLPYKVVAFDLDGTLLKGYTFSWTLVWDYLGYSKKVQKAGMKRYRAGETTYNEWCTWACNLFIEKNLRRTDFSAITQNITLTKNFYETIRLLKKEGIILALISGGIDTFLEEKLPDAEKLFDYIFINKLTFDEHGRLYGVKSTDYDFAGKAKALEMICEINGCTLKESVFVGEGFNDQDVSNIAGKCIAYPPTTDQGVSEVANVGIHEDNLSLILEHIIIN